MPFAVARGTNISHWLSQSGRRGQERLKFFTQTDVKRIADWGFDHIRLPIDEEQMWNDNLQRENEAFDLLQQALDWAATANLRVIVDLHILRSHFFNDQTEPRLFTDPAEANRFAGLWADLSAAMHTRSTDAVAYELMNEAVAADADNWNRVAHVAFNTLRQLEPTRTIVLGSNRWNSAQTFDALRIPNDPHQVLTFHYYNPMLVTHYRASWVTIGQYTGPIQYPGKPVADADLAAVPEPLRKLVADNNKTYDAATMRADLAQPLAARAKTHLPLYCGEFGCVRHCPDPLRHRWYRDFLTLLKNEHIAWGNWDYQGDFGLITPAGESTGLAEVMLAI